ncbi:MAG: tetratricopeptide repeat-containing sensor histidine kinase [Cyclobacteriaceae bacterium]
MRSLFYLSAYSTSPADEVKYAKHLLSLAEEFDNQEYLVKGNLRMGVAHRMMGNLGQALTYLFEGAEIALEQESTEYLVTEIYIEIATCYTQNKDSENALRYGLKAIAMLRSTDRKDELAINLLNIAYDYYLIGKYDTALKYLDESALHFNELDLTIGKAYFIGNRSLVLWKLGEIELAIDGLQTAIEMLEPLGDHYGIADYYNQLGHIYLESGSIDQVVEYANKALELSKQEQLKEQTRDAYQLLFLSNKQIKNSEQALEFQSAFHLYEDSIQNQETTLELAKLEAQFELKKSQTEVELLLQQKRNTQLIIIFGTVFLVVVIALAVLIYVYYRSKSRLNKQLNEQKDSLVELNDTKDKFFSIISHDLRGPVSVLNGLSYVIKKDLDLLEPDEINEMVDQMQDSASSLVKLLDNLLHWALQQKGEIPYQPEYLHVKDLLSDTVEIFNPMAKSKKITLDLVCQSDHGINTDLNSTMTIFRNLMNNAIKFTPVNGKITIEAIPSDDNQNVLIKFIDSGVGISENKLSDLLGKQKSDSTRGTQGETGLGLGLQLVYEFVHLNKGSIDITSELGKGTTITVAFPKA